MLLRELFVRLGLDVDAQSFAKGNLAVEVVKTGLRTLVNMGHALEKRFEETLEAGDKIKKTSQKIGIATDALQELQYAADLADVSAESMAMAVGKLSMNLVNAKAGSEESAKALKGINFKKANGELKSTDEVLAEVAEKFEKMPDGPEKTAQAMKLFGKSGKDMIPLLNEGADGLERMRQEARDLGLVLDTEAIEASEELNDNFKRLQQITTGLWRTAIAPLIPAINKLVEKFLAWRKANAGIMAQKLREFVSTLIKSIDGLWSVFKSLLSIVNVFVEGVKNIVHWVGELAERFVLVKIALLALGAILAGVFAPFHAIGAVIAGLMLVFDDLRAYSQGRKSLFGLWKKTIDDWTKPSKEDPWFLVAIKQFVKLISQAIDMIKEFDDVTGSQRYNNPKNIDRKAGAAPEETKRQGDNITLDTAKKRLALGMPLTDPAKEALARAGVTEEAFTKRYSPAAISGVPDMLSAPKKGSLTPSFAPELVLPKDPTKSSTTLHAPVVMHITQQPGESGEALGERVREEINLHWNSKMEEAGSGVLR